tara:strand:- start:383 stop:1030 length:648 start_codon:yes stop_codon:yes gene_type:complete
MKPIPKRVLITGTGRCGTSAFVKFLREYIDLNLLCTTQQHYFVRDNDPIMGNTTTEWNVDANAGLEYVLDHHSSDDVFQNSPYIFKDTRLCSGLDQILKNKKMEVEHLFILIRDYRKSALSRKNKDMWFTEWGSIRCKDERKSKLQNQIEFNQRSIGKLMETVAIYDVPHTVIHFPRFAEESGYLARKLRNTPLAIPADKLQSAFAIFDKDQINF